MLNKIVLDRGQISNWKARLALLPVSWNVSHAFNPNFWEAEAGGVLGQPRLPTEIPT